MKTKTSLSLLVIFCLTVGSLFAQTTTTTTTTKTTKKKSTHTSSAAMKQRVNADASRLAGLLSDAQTTVSVNPDVWKTIGNEANSLANRLYGSTSGNATARKAATSARDHVREFRKAALAGDAGGARDHASQAMPFVVQLIDWSM
jgi:hypothetical protein